VFFDAVAEPELKKEFRETMVEDIEFEFGKPSDIEDLENGWYIYTYYLKPLNGKKKKEEYYRFLFDEDGRVRNVQSNRLVEQRQFNVGDTVFTILFFTVILPTGIILLAGMAAEK
jgi:hypothetical protein